MIADKHIIFRQKGLGTSGRRCRRASQPSIILFVNLIFLSTRILACGSKRQGQAEIRLMRIQEFKTIIIASQMFILTAVGFQNRPNGSAVFGRVIDYATQNIRRCSLREQNGRRSMVITNVPTVEEANKVLKSIA